MKRLIVFWILSWSTSYVVPMCREDCVRVVELDHRFDEVGDAMDFVKACPEEKCWGWRLEEVHD